MDYTKAFTFAKDDSQWITKLLIGVVMTFLSFLILPAFVLMGYQLNITRRVMDGAEGLPEWDDYGQLLIDGLKIFAVQVVYSLPIFAIYLIGIVPLAIVSDQGGGAAEEFSGVIALMLVCVAILMSILVGLLVPAVVIQYAKTGELSACFRFAEVWQIFRENTTDIIISLLVSIAAVIVLSIVIPLSIVTCIGPIVLAIVGPLWLSAGQYHMYGQIGAKSNGSKFSEKEFDLAI